MSEKAYLTTVGLVALVVFIALIISSVGAGSKAISEVPLEGLLMLLGSVALLATLVGCAVAGFLGTMMGSSSKIELEGRGGPENPSANNDTRD